MNIHSQPKLPLSNIASILSLKNKPYNEPTKHEQPIFVFGSNQSGRHGKGAAKYAHKFHGAIYGRGEGLQGNSYAIPTKDFNLQRLALFKIKRNIERFIEFANVHTELHFLITKIGSGLAGYHWEHQICPLFPEKLPNNCEII
jgi:hypothetical protein